MQTKQIAIKTIEKIFIQPTNRWAEWVIKTLKPLFLKETTSEWYLPAVLMLSAMVFMVLPVMALFVLVDTLIVLSVMLGLIAIFLTYKRLTATSTRGIEWI